MPTELEAKMKIDDLAKVRQRLRDLGAVELSNALETNIFFDTEDRKLLSQDKGLRLRHERSQRDNSEKMKITFKGPRQKGPLKSRDEREMKVDNLGDALALLEGLDFRRVLSFQKRRESWKFNDCQVELDELPHLGTFVEIEGPDDQTIFKVRALLELDKSPVISSSYASLLFDHLQTRGVKDRVVTF